MADSTISGYPGGGMHPGHPYGPSYGGGLSMTLHEKLHECTKRKVTVYLGPDAIAVSGVLSSVGTNYIELQRVVNSVSESLFVPMHAITAISIPM